MKILETKYLPIGEEKYPIRMSYKAYILFEELSGKSVEDMSTMKDMTQLLYSGIKMGCNYEKKKFKLSYEEFLDFIDDYPQLMAQIRIADLIQVQEEVETKKK